MDTPPPNHKLKIWMSLAIGLVALAGVVMLLSCLVLVVATPRVIDAVWLRPLADQLGTETSKAALVAHVTELLEDHEGTGREEIHQRLDEIGSFTYRETVRRRDGISQEDVYWTLAELPIGIPIVAGWSLRYDNKDRLIEVLPDES